MASDISRAAHILRQGGLVAFATETVYGLGADATNDDAVAKIFAAKGRPQFNPLISHVAEYEHAFKLGHFPPLAQKLAEAFWPGPLTLVVERRNNCPISLLCSAGLNTVALRVPAHPLALALLREVARPVAAPSANVSGRISPTTADHVRKSLGAKLDMVLDGGPSQVGLESTVVHVAGDEAVLLRAGGVSRTSLQDVLGREVLLPAHTPQTLHAPGMLESHYAPRAPLRVNAESARPNEVYLGFGPFGNNGPTLSRSGNLQEAAANLFKMLHAIDDSSPEAIAVAPIPLEGLGEAINDRLKRAAAPRSQE